MTYSTVSSKCLLLQKGKKLHIQIQHTQTEPKHSTCCMLHLSARLVSACSVQFKPVNSIGGLGLHTGGYKAGSLGYT